MPLTDGPSHHNPQPHEFSLAPHDCAVSIIIAAKDEEALIGRCLRSLLVQTDFDGGAAQVIVAANGCADATVAEARRYAEAFAERKWSLIVLDLPAVGKLGALNAAEQHATGLCLAYLDADVICTQSLLAEIVEALKPPSARYATGRLAVARAQTAFTRAYARVWSRLPFVQAGTVGAGFFAMNRAGRGRWGDWPAIISDDTFARLQFTPAERFEVKAEYQWPMVEGFRNLVRVRRRQDAGVNELRRLHPAIMANESKQAITPGLLTRLALFDPIGFSVYLTVHVFVRLSLSNGDWTRGR